MVVMEFSTRHDEGTREGYGAKNTETKSESDLGTKKCSQIPVRDIWRHLLGVFSRKLLTQLKRENAVSVA